MDNLMKNLNQIRIQVWDEKFKKWKWYGGEYNKFDDAISVMNKSHKNFGHKLRVVYVKLEISDYTR